jgi:hypothetical protein
MSDKLNVDKMCAYYLSYSKKVNDIMIYTIFTIPSNKK